MTFFEKSVIIKYEEIKWWLDVIYALIGCLIIIGFLGFKLSKKVKIDNERLEKVK